MLSEARRHAVQAWQAGGGARGSEPRASACLILRSRGRTVVSSKRVLAFGAENIVSPKRETAPAPHLVVVVLPLEHLCMPGELGQKKG